MTTATITVDAVATADTITAIGAQLPNTERILADKRYAAACHEAAHCVAHIHYRVPFESVILYENDGVLTKEGDTILGAVFPVQHMTLIPTKDSMRQAATFAAGIAFQLLVDGPLGYAENDYKEAKTWCLYSRNDDAFEDAYTPTPKEVEAANKTIFTKLVPKLFSILISNWKSLCAVGDELLNRGCLTRKEVLEITKLFN